MGFTISSEYTVDMTFIPNWFIRDYMPSANGNFIKMYLYLAMMCETPREETDLSVNSLADYLECTENDVLRALRYWQKEGLVSFTKEDGQITSIALLDHRDTANSEAVASDDASSTSIWQRKEEPDRPIPVRQHYTPSQAEALIKDQEIDQTISGVERMMGRTISATHLQMILYFMCDVGFTQEMILAMYQTALSKGKDSPKYIEAIGINWAKKGYKTLKQAKDESSEYRGIYHLVSKTLGIDRTLAPAERDVIDSWRDYDFPDEVLEEACRRTVLQTGTTNLKYVSGILEKWHAKHVTSLADIEKIDAEFQKKRKASASTQSKQKASTKKNQFQNFPQRTYSEEDYDNLEQKLMHRVQAES